MTFLLTSRRHSTQRSHRGGYRMPQTRFRTGTFGKLRRYLGGKSRVAALVAACLLMVGSRATTAAPPAGEMRWALYVTFAPAWLDPGEVAVAGVTPFWLLYALHD